MALSPAAVGRQLVLLAVLVWAFWPSAVEVETALAQRGRFEDTILEDGQTRVRERYVVSAPLAGTLLRIDFKVGDPIEAGTVIASVLPNRAPLLDPRARQEAEQRVGAAEATVARAGFIVARLDGIAKQARVDPTVPVPSSRKALPHTVDWSETHSR